MDQLKNDKKILVIEAVEDDVSLRNVLRDKLVLEGFGFFEANNGVEGLATALRERPDIILLDIAMPQMNGIEMMEKLRQSGSWGKNIPVILLTNLDGHSGYKNNKPGVFDNLYKLKKGDKIYVEDEKGAVTIFVVREIKKYDRNANALNVFTSSDGKAHLNLITCTGDWDRIWKTHSQRLIVFTDKI